MVKHFVTAGLLVVLSACSDATEPVETTNVGVIDNSFTPAANSVAPNQTVTWTWNGSNSHNVTFDDSSIGSSATQMTGTFSTSFPAAGEYTYYCTVHGRDVMSGSVVAGSGSASNGGTGGGY